MESTSITIKPFILKPRKKSLDKRILRIILYLITFLIIASLILAWKHGLFPASAILLFFPFLYITFLLKKSGIILVNPQGLVINHHLFFKVKIPFQDIIRVRKGKMKSELLNKEVTVVTLVVSSKNPFLISHSSPIQKLVFGSDRYEEQDLETFYSIVSMVLSKGKQKKVSNAQLMKEHGNLIKKYQGILLKEELVLAFLNSLMVFLVITSVILFFEFPQRPFVIGTIAILTIASFIISLTGRKINILGLIDRNEYGAILVDPDKGVTRFRLVAYPLTQFTIGDTIIYKDNQPIKGTFSRAYPDKLEPTDIVHFIVETKGDHQKAIALHVLLKNETQTQWVYVPLFPTD